MGGKGGYGSGSGMGKGGYGSGSGKGGKGNGSGKGGKGMGKGGKGSGKGGKGSQGSGKGGKGSQGSGKGGKGGKGSGNGGKGSKCPSFDDLISQIDSKTGDEQCFLAKMGWVDNDFNFLQDVYETDMASLNSDLTDRFDQEELDDCANKMMKKLGTAGGKCLGSYTDEEAQNLQLIGEAVAYGTCGHKMFEKACGAFVKERFVQFMMSATSPTIGK